MSLTKKYAVAQFFLEFHVEDVLKGEVYKGVEGFWNLRAEINGPCYEIINFRSGM